LGNIYENVQRVVETDPVLERIALGPHEKKVTIHEKNKGCSTSPEQQLTD
jgi:hypothetical protein